MSAHPSLFIAEAAAHPEDGFTRALPYVLVGVVVLIILDLVTSKKSLGGVSRWNWWETLLYLGTVVSVAILGFTSFGAMFSRGGLQGWTLFAHMLGAGVLVAVLPLLALTWCAANRFGRPRGAEQAADDKQKFHGFAKAMFWIKLTGGLVVTMTMLLSMLPVFGTEDLRALLVAHRYAGLVVVLALIFHLYIVLRCKLSANRNAT